MKQYPFENATVFCEITTSIWISTSDPYSRKGNEISVALSGDSLSWN